MDLATWIKENKLSKRVVGALVGDMNLERYATTEMDKAEASNGLCQRMEDWLIPQYPFMSDCIIMPPSSADTNPCDPDPIDPAVTYPTSEISQRAA